MLNHMFTSERVIVNMATNTFYLFMHVGFWNTRLMAAHMMGNLSFSLTLVRNGVFADNGISFNLSSAS